MTDLYANPKCKFCLGKGFALTFMGGQQICGCIGEQIRIIATGDGSRVDIIDRYTPAIGPSYVPFRDDVQVDPITRLLVKRAINALDEADEAQKSKQSYCPHCEQWHSGCCQNDEQRH